MLLIETATVDKVMTWQRMVEAMKRGHVLGKPAIDDILLQQKPDSILVRCAWIAGMGLAVKAATIFPGNAERKPEIPTIQGHVMVFDKDTGAVTALIDAIPVTRWKTAGDSALGCSILSRQDSRHLLMVGAGTMAEPLVRAHISVRPGIERITIWNRTRARADQVAGRLEDLGRTVTVADSLEAAVRTADIVSAATMTLEPIIAGAWLRPGTHLDLVGAYRLDMREADDEAMRRGRVFVDFRGTTIGHIGEIATPLRSGVIQESDIVGDLYDLVPGRCGRQADSDITIFKNGGGAHLDLMTSHAIIEAVRSD